MLNWCYISVCLSQVSQELRSSTSEWLLCRAQVMWLNYHRSFPGSRDALWCFFPSTWPELLEMASLRRSASVGVCVPLCMSSLAACLCWRLVIPLLLSLNSSQTRCQDQNSLLGGFFGLDFLPLFWSCCDLPADGSDLCLLSGHLPTPSLYDHRELACVSSSSGWFQTKGHNSLHGPDRCHCPVALLWSQCDCHHFCGLHPLFRLACTRTSVEGVIVLAKSLLISVFSFLLLVSSYVIILVHLGHHSAEGRH